MPASFAILGVIAMALYILFNYLLPDPPNPPRGYWFKTVVTVIVIIIVLLLWFVLPVHVG
jgi:4-hydroxybenzoate polyprenyltransferase